MKTVILDGYSINPGDLSWDSLSQFGELTVYPTTDDCDVISRIGDADYIFTSKCRITGDVIKSCPNLKFIGELATGYDNISVDSAKDYGISVYYTPAYSTEAVAQHAIALLLELSNNVAKNNRLSEQGHWMTKPDFSYSWAPVTLLSGKSMGIVGYGNIGKRVAKIAQALGMTVNIYSRDKDACITSDVISLHAPANEDTYHMIDDEFISKMKDGAFIINTARGALIDEAALYNGLISGKLRGAALDVLEKEPPSDNPLIGLDNCLVTPHIAWIPKETRQKVIDTAYMNLKNYLNKDGTNCLTL